MQWVESEPPVKVLALMGNFLSQLHNDARQYPSFAQRLAQVVADAALSEGRSDGEAGARVDEVTVSVRKLRPPVPHDLAFAGVRITRRGAVG